MKPAGHTAVMASCAAGEVVGDNAKTALYRRLEFFPTPPWAARAGGELIQRLDPPPVPRGWWAWESACGQGQMAGPLASYFDVVRATDIHDHGWGGQDRPPLDFLHLAADAVDQIDWIITNPPFGLAAEFVEAGLRRARRGVAILVRQAFFESEGRWPLFFGEHPCGVKASFFERVPMQLGRWEPKGSTATAYAWFVWFRPEVEPEWVSEFRRLTRARGLFVLPDAGIPPGTKARLTRPDDARLWGARGAAPLFDMGGIDD
jgi:hypothetical protein